MGRRRWMMIGFAVLALGLIVVLVAAALRDTPEAERSCATPGAGQTPECTVPDGREQSAGDEGAAADGPAITYFWGSGCGVCEEATPALERLAERHGVGLVRFEVWEDADNRALYERVAAAHDVDPSGTPGIFLGGRAWIGFSDRIRDEVEDVAETCAEGGECPDLVAAVRAGGPVPDPIPTSSSRVIDVPLIGEVDLGGRSLLWSTILIAFVDGFNPCSLWVITILLAMVLRGGSRARAAAVGVTYLAAAALVYGLFLAGAVGALAATSLHGPLQYAIAAFALAFAAVNIKDFFAFGKGISLTIPARYKPRIARSAAAIMRTRGLPSALAATAALAAAVSLFELPCTVGMPVIWSNIVSAESLPTAEYAVLIGVYLAVFLIDELMVFGVAMATMRIGRVTERHGRALKLAGGSLMAVIAFFMLADPELLSTAGGAVVLLGAAVALAAVLAATERWVLPALRH